ncbi:MAG: hypothetical protein U0470_07330 [Anaerolineae bacterium]
MKALDRTAPTWCSCCWARPQRQEHAAAPPRAQGGGRQQPQVRRRARAACRCRSTCRCPTTVRTRWARSRRRPRRGWRTAGRCYPALPLLDDLLAEGRVLLLLDGLNEMPHASDADNRERIGVWKTYLHTIVAGQPGNRALVACRRLDYSAQLSTPTPRVPQPRSSRWTTSSLPQFIPGTTCSWPRRSTTG